MITPNKNNLHKIVSAPPTLYGIDIKRIVAFIAYELGWFEKTILTVVPEFLADKIDLIVNFLQSLVAAAKNGEIETATISKHIIEDLCKIEAALGPYVKELAYISSVIRAFAQKYKVS